MSWEQRNEYFCKAQTDMQIIYIEAEREAKQLKAENAKLRELMYERAHKHAIHHMTEDELRITAANMLDENAKLRELCADMWRFTGTACKKYPRLFDPAAQGGQMVQPNMLDSFEQRMRELGIEVDE